MLIFMLLLMGITTTTHAAKLGATLQERMAADEPLEDPVDQCKQAEPNLKVPNVVHYIWFGCKRKFLSYHYLSVLSALSSVAITQNKIFGKEIKRPEHQADVARIELLMRYGGIYLDDTQIVTRSMDPLRKLSCSMPYEKKGTLMNGVIVAEPNAAFLKKWFFLGYQDFEDNRWAWNSCRKPYFLWEKYPDMLHVEPQTFLPSWDQWEQLFFDNNYPWRENKNYAVHIYHKRYRQEHSVSELISFNNTVGDLARHTLENYNSWSLKNVNETNRADFDRLLDEKKL